MVRSVGVRSPSLASAAQDSTYPFEAASSRVCSIHGQPFSRAHFSISRWPPSAARAHVRQSHGQPFSRAPRLAHRGGRPLPPTRTSTYPTGSRSRAPTSAPRAGRTSPRSRTSTRSTGSRSRAPASTSRWPPNAGRRASASPTGSRSRAPTSESRGGRPRGPRASTRSHGQSFSRNHFSVSRWPPNAASPHVFSSTGNSPRGAAALQISNTRSATVVEQSTSSAQTRRAHIPASAARFSNSFASARSACTKRMPLLTARAARVFKKRDASKGKSEMATPACALRSCFLLRPLTLIPRAATPTIAANGAPGLAGVFKSALPIKKRGTTTPTPQPGARRRISFTPRRRDVRCQWQER